MRLTTLRSDICMMVFALCIAISGAWRIGSAGQEKAPPKAPKKAPEELPFTPGGKWRAHDLNRPQPVVIIPPIASTQDSPGQPPSDAVVLFDGRDLSQWVRMPRKDDKDRSERPKWKIENGYMEVVPETGSIFTREKFADCQIHIEWATPAKVEGSSQGRGNSGVLILGHPEVQVLDSYQNETYADGSAAALYGFYPPLVNASRKPAEWQTYDFFYFAPRFDEQRKLLQSARYTVIHNGILVHHAVDVPGSVVEITLGLQDHNNPVRYRNIWLRRLKGYDER